MSGNLLRRVLRTSLRLTLKPMLGPTPSISTQRRLLKLLGVATLVPAGGAKIASFWLTRRNS